VSLTYDVCVIIYDCNMFIIQVIGHFGSILYNFFLQIDAMNRKTILSESIKCNRTVQDFGEFQPYLLVSGAEKAPFQHNWASATIMHLTA
jgi:hypothetical protein